LSLGHWKLDCEACTESQKIERGCEKDSPIPDAWTVGEFTFQRCPVKELDPKTYLYLRAFNWYRRGYLPSSGGWMDQTNKFVEAVAYIEAEAERIKKANG